MKNFWYLKYKYIPRSYRKVIQETGWESLESIQKVVILEQFHGFSHFFDASQFSNSEIIYLITKQSSLITYFDISKLNDFEIVSILKSRPNLHTYFNLQDLREYCIADLLNSQPQMLSLFQDLKITNPYILDEFPNLRNLLSKQNV